MRYVIINDPHGVPMSIMDTETMWQFPFSEDNAMYRQYLAWIAEGNTPEPWEEN